jgi:hypothetical protein
MTATAPSARRISSRQTESILREAAYVLHLTRQVKDEILRDTRTGRAYSAPDTAAILPAANSRP